MAEGSPSGGMDQKVMGRLGNLGEPPPVMMGKRMGFQRPPVALSEVPAPPALSIDQSSMPCVRRGV